MQKRVAGHQRDSAGFYVFLEEGPVEEVGDELGPVVVIGSVKELQLELLVLVLVDMEVELQLDSVFELGLLTLKGLGQLDSKLLLDQQNWDVHLREPFQQFHF